MRSERRVGTVVDEAVGRGMRVRILHGISAATGIMDAAAPGGGAMKFTVWCAVDGSVEVSVDDVTTVIVRSGSDVEIAFTCPVCGAPIAVRAEVPQGLAGLVGRAWGDVQSGHSEAWVVPAAQRAGGDSRADVGETRRIDAYVEYFRRELAAADTVESMVALMDAGAGR
jgi:hypothetical protein